MRARRQAIVAPAREAPAPLVSPRRALGTALLAVGAWQAVRLARTLRRELTALRTREARLRSSWTTIPATPHAPALRLHARIADRAPAGGPAVVLVHGYGIGSRYFVPLLDDLSRDLRVYAPELPGHGVSAHAPSPLSIVGLAQALAAWMDAQGIRAAIVVGHSMGTQIVVELTVRRPELVAGVLLVAPTLDASARARWRQLLRALRTVPAERPALLAAVSLDYLRAGPRVILREMQHMLDHRLEARLPALHERNVPVRVARGARDRVSTDDWCTHVGRLAGAPPTAQVACGGHAVHFAEPSAVARLVRQMVGQMARAPR